jgi:disulfide oxidoreductase YuzD
MSIITRSPVYFTAIHADDVEQGYLMSRNIHKIGDLLDKIGEAILTVKDFNRNIKYEKIAIIHKDNPEHTQTFIDLANVIKDDDLVYFPINMVKNGMLVKLFGEPEYDQDKVGMLRFRYDMYKINVLLESALICDLVLPNYQ